MSNNDNKIMSTAFKVTFCVNDGYIADNKLIGTYDVYI